MSTEDYVLAAIWTALGLVGIFTLYGYMSPRIQKSWVTKTAKPAA